MKPTAPFVRNPYNYDTAAAGEESGLKCRDPSRTKQSFSEEADINTIVRRFSLTGELPSNIRLPTYGDFTGVRDFKTALDAIAIAEESFYSMPASVRTRFDNDPQKFLEFCGDDNNREEALKMGLVPQPAQKPSEPPELLKKPPEGKKTPNPKGEQTDT